MDENNLFELGVSLLGLGVGASILFPQSSTLIYTSYLFVVSAILYKALNLNKWPRFFRACGLCVKEDKDILSPSLIERTKTSYGYCLRFKPVAGLTTKDLIAKQDKFEEFLNARVEISYWNKNIFIKVFDSNSLENDFELVDTKGIVELVIGRGYRGVETLDLSASESNVHLLIAGTTGGGKTSLLRSIITTLIATKDPKELKLFLLDLKGTELRIFERCGMVEGFARDTEESFELLKKVRKEVDRRNNLFYERDVVDILEYNRKYKKLPHWLVVADEFHLLRNSESQVGIFEELAAICRSVGIHLILCTQRPSADVITGLLKANIPTVIGLKTNNELNSRIILGESESDLARLRGKGHGILKKGGEKVEFQGMWLAPEDAREILKSYYVERENNRAEAKIGEVDLAFLDRYREQKHSDN